MANESLQIDKICRTCLSEDQNMRSVYTIDETLGETARLYEMLMSCATVQVNEGDGLPNQVCLQCVHYITRAFSFKQLCERSDSTLRQFLGRNEDKYLEELKPCKAETPQIIVNDIILDIKDEDISSNNEPLEVPTIESDCDNLPPMEILNENRAQNEGRNKVKYLEELKPCKPETPQSIVNDIILDIKEEDISTNNEPLEFPTIESDCDNLPPMETLNKNRGQNEGRNEVKYLEELKPCKPETPQIIVNDIILDIKEEDISTNNEPLEFPTIESDCDNLPPMETLNENQVETVKKKRVVKKCEKVKDDTDQPIYPCEECMFCFTTVSDLKDHLRTYHKDSQHICEVCNEGFASASILCQHSKVHESVKRIPAKTHTGEKPFHCKQCGKSFAQSFRLREHMRAHANEKSFVCSVCSKAFSRYKTLVAHSKTHTGINSQICTVCGKRLCGAGSLALHMKTHTGLKDHICPYCGKGFKTPSYLIIHKRTHTGERPYICKVCGKGFPCWSRLTAHSQSHSGEKPHVCNICGTGCVSASLLKKHMRIHTGEKPYQCKLCPKVFPRSQDLRIHTKTHTGDRNYVCNICKKGFYQGSTLKVHLRIHTGEKPYTCNICNKTFSQTGALSRHRKTH